MDFTLNLAVADLERTARFYREVLGLEPETYIPLPGGPPVLLLRTGESAIIFRELEVVEALHPALFQNLQRHPLGVGMSLQFAVPDLRPIRRGIERRQLHTLYELEDAEFGRRELWLHDPDGYLLILLQED
jgi:catechol 2,3-dioxygenase-like lactoylglutathione lyase family enzyme